MKPVKIDKKKKKMKNKFFLFVVKLVEILNVTLMGLCTICWGQNRDDEMICSLKKKNVRRAFQEVIS